MDAHFTPLLEEKREKNAASAKSKIKLGTCQKTWGGSLKSLKPLRIKERKLVCTK